MNTTNDYDSPWKEAIDVYFPEFMEFFFPEAYEDIDWSRDFESLDKELQQVVRDASLGKRLADKLVKVWLKTGEETIVFIHIEIQGEYDSLFQHRMFVYHYRIYDRYYQPNTKIVSLAILGDDRPSWKPQEYQYFLWDCQLNFKFPTRKLLDYQTQLDTLEEEKNPFAIIITAHLRAKQTINNPTEKLNYKFSLVRRLYEQGYSKNDILQLFRLIDWILVLPVELAQSFDQQLNNYEEEKRMPYITSIERHGIEKGIEQGIEQGMLNKARESVIEVLEVKFNSIPNDLKQTINNLDNLEVLKQLMRQAVVISSLTEFEELLP